MIWLFVILGLVGLASALHGLGLSALARRGLLLQALAVVLFVAAWVVGHENFVGWFALAAGMLTTLLGHFHRSKSETPDAAGQDELTGGRDARTIEQLEGDASEAPEPAVALPPPPPPAPPRSPSPPPLVSWVLLSDPWQFAPDVFLASLRRSGQRTARLEGPTVSGKSATFAVGPVKLELEYAAGPFDAHTIEDAAAQSWEWPEALATARTHAARIRFTTRVDRYEREGQASRHGVLRLHGLAHQALAEFAPVAAILWPDAERLLPPDAAAEKMEAGSVIMLASSTAVNFRTFPLEGDEAGWFLCDSMGMDALGLLDVQVTVEGEPDDTVSRALYALAERQLETNATPQDETQWPPDATPRWRLRRGTARFGRARDVLAMEPIEAEDAGERGAEASPQA